MTNKSIFNVLMAALIVLIAAFSFTTCDFLDMLLEEEDENSNNKNRDYEINVIGYDGDIDSFGVQWRDAWFQPGFRLPSNKLLNWR